jgi:hypothetical protein
MSNQDRTPYVATQSPEPTSYPLQPGYPDQQPAYGVLRDNSDATVSLVLGLVGLCTFLLLASPFAWWLGARALAEIDATPGVYNNRGMAVAGKITGIIGTVLLAFFVVGGILAVLFLFTATSTTN